MGRMDDQLAREFPEETERYETAMDRLRFPEDHVKPENLQVETIVCGGCGTTTVGRQEGWRFTDAPWCPKCAWLA